jgi:formylglycine-generating enzyme required for sulfatase activity
MMDSLNLDTFRAMSSEMRLAFSQGLAEKLKSHFQVAESSEDALWLPTFIHKQSQLTFRYIPGGTHNMGMSELEEAAARKIFDPPPLNLNEMRPVHEVTVSPFLVSISPVTNQVVSKIWDLNTEKTGDAYAPAFLSRDKVEVVASLLNCRLPYETEWEYICRANTKTLFPFGDTLPDDAELEQWLSWNFRDLSLIKSNSFGIYGLFTAEWCHDKYRKNYMEEFSASEESYVIRGGGAFFWPWQDQEWVWCMSAMRMPSSDLLDQTCGFRLVYPICDPII